MQITGAPSASTVAASGHTFKDNNVRTMISSTVLCHLIMYLYQSCQVHHECNASTSFKSRFSKSVWILHKGNSYAPHRSGTDTMVSDTISYITMLCSTRRLGDISTICVCSRWINFLCKCRPDKVLVWLPQSANQSKWLNAATTACKYLNRWSFLPSILTFGSTIVSGPTVGLENSLAGIWRKMHERYV